jgi:hypothetical protein
MHIGKLHFLIAIMIHSIVVFAQSEWVNFGYEMRTSGPNRDHILFIEKELWTKQSYMVHCRFLDQAWDEQPPLFAIPLKGFAIGADLNTHLMIFERLQVDLRCGTMAYKAQSYNYGGNVRWFMIPTTFLNTETLLCKSIYIGIGFGAIWFLHNDSYRNYSTILHEEIALTIKYRIN